MTHICRLILARNACCSRILTFKIFIFSKQYIIFCYYINRCKNTSATYKQILHLCLCLHSIESLGKDPWLIKAHCPGPYAAFRSGISVQSCILKSSASLIEIQILHLPLVGVELEPSCVSRYLPCWYCTP
jgi:hypothetical protein